MFGRVIPERVRSGRDPAQRLLGGLLWAVCLLAGSGCAQFGGTRSAMYQPPAGELVVESPAGHPAAPRRARSSRSLTPVRGHVPPTARAVQSTPEWASPPGEESGFLPPETPPTVRDPVPPRGPLFTEVPGGYWIVSSRQASLPPTDIDSSRSLVYLYRTPHSMQAFPREVFLQTLRADRPTCITIHGSYNYWPDVLTESVHSLRWIQQAAQGQEVQFVYFSWPADGYAFLVFPLELAVMGRRASRHSLYLANLISQFPNDQPVCLVGHSHGARCSVAALHTLGGGALEDGSRLAPGLGVPRRMNAVLLAAAVDHDWLNPGERYGAALPVTERMLVMQNERDSWLNAYPLKDLLGNRQALGRGGFQEDDTIRMSDQIGKISVLDASPFAGRSHDFRAFHSRAELADAISPFVLFRSESEPPLEERLTPPESPADPQSVARPISSRPPSPNGRDTSRGPDAVRRSAPLPASSAAAPRGNVTSADADFAPQPRPTRASRPPETHRLPNAPATSPLLPRTRGRL